MQCNKPRKKWTVPRTMHGDYWTSSSRDRSPPLDSSPHPIAFNEKTGSGSCMSCAGKVLCSDTIARLAKTLRARPAFLGASHFWIHEPPGLNAWIGLVWFFFTTIGLVWLVARFLWEWAMIIAVALRPLAVMLTESMVSTKKKKELCYGAYVYRLHCFTCTYKRIYIIPCPKIEKNE
jgi:hypothetical protein